MKIIKETYETRLRAKKEWHLWFAWKPVWVKPGEKRWLERVWRKGEMTKHRDDIHVWFSWKFQYHAIEDFDMTTSPFKPGSGSMSEELKAALEASKDHVMTAQEKFEQKCSFVYSGVMDNPLTGTREEFRQRFAEQVGYPLKEMEELARLRLLIADIDYIKNEPCVSLTIVNDNEEASTIHEQSCVEYCGQWSDYDVKSFHGVDWQEAVTKVAAHCRLEEEAANKSEKESSKGME